MDYEAKRTAVLADSLADAHATRWGYFGITGSLAIGDNSTVLASPKRQEKDENAEPIRNVQTNPCKKGNTKDCYFEFMPGGNSAQPLCIDDPYMDPHLRDKREKVKMLDPEASFKPPGFVSQRPNKLGYEYIEHATDNRDPTETYAKYKGVQPIRNFYTNSAKKGGAGNWGQGVLFGDPDNERKDWEHVGDSYDAARMERRKELEAHHAKMPEMKFRGMHYGKEPFHPDMDVFLASDQPCGIPREKVAPIVQAYPHEMPFRPANPGKAGQQGCMTTFPEWISEPSPGGAPYRGKDSGEERAPFKPCHPRTVHNPMPSVVTAARNLRVERPSAFMRPSFNH